ncbi:hypothetical protein FB45DRAFT_500659 [Roridomyces roridus]|uniref:Uncharacterized protein n=1 Tax=Roridomyces roridus TaxID=1738132 RepID=A0AAD7FMH2_9AGAR|nr:hypothetical protein FB45DRAFT_500659 [Roridomyces roridus]
MLPEEGGRPRTLRRFSVNRDCGVEIDVSRVTEGGGGCITATHPSRGSEWRVFNYRTTVPFHHSQVVPLARGSRSNHPAWRTQYGFAEPLDHVQPFNFSVAALSQVSRSHDALCFESSDSSLATPPSNPVFCLPSRHFRSHATVQAHWPFFFPDSAGAFTADRGKNPKQDIENTTTQDGTCVQSGQRVGSSCMGTLNSVGHGQNSVKVPWLRSALMIHHLTVIQLHTMG